jgi:hypothetical protein
MNAIPTRSAQFFRADRLPCSPAIPLAKEGYSPAPATLARSVFTVSAETGAAALPQELRT